MMSKILEYDVIKENNKVDLVENVNRAIEKGWQPYGSFELEYEVSGNNLVFMQPIVKFEEDTEENGDDTEE